jgi:hypothetical protein
LTDACDSMQPPNDDDDAMCETNVCDVYITIYRGSLLVSNVMLEKTGTQGW